MRDKKRKCEGKQQLVYMNIYIKDTITEYDVILHNKLNAAGLWLFTYYLHKSNEYYMGSFKLYAH